MIGDESVVVEFFTCDFAGDGQFTPVDVERLGWLPQGDVGDETISPVLVPLTGPDTLLALGHRAELVQQGDLLVQGGMRIGLAGQDEVQVMLQEQFTERLVTVQVVGQDCHLPSCETNGVAQNPTVGGIAFAILFVGPLLGDDELRFQHQHFLFAWLRQDGE